MANHSSLPSYRFHKSSGQAIVTLTTGCGGRRDILLGRYGSEESTANYNRVVGEWVANGRRLVSPAALCGARHEQRQARRKGRDFVGFVVNDHLSQIKVGVAA